MLQIMIKQENSLVKKLKNLIIKFQFRRNQKMIF